MDWGQFVVQWLHVGLGIVWFGTVLYTAIILIPAISRLPLSEQRRVGSLIGEQGFKVIRPVAGAVILLGLIRGTLFGPIKSLDALTSAYGITWLLVAGVTFGRGRPDSELEIVRALNAASLPTQARTGRHRWRLVAPCRTRGFEITVGSTRLPYGRSTNGNGYLTHVVTGLLLAWRRGRMVGAQVRWRCGARTMYFRLIDEPDSVLCPVCTLQRGPRWP